MKIKTIPANPVFAFPRPQRVAAYCRVSTTQEIQYHSLEAQREYYSKYIDSKIDWIFVGIYADQASGRHNLRMKEFQRMMADCRAGKIDYIIVKSISRLGRNTLQFLNTCSELIQLNIDVYFQTENLHIRDPQAIRILTIYASLYQNESESKSHNVRWGNIVRFQDGSSKLFDRPCYGYCSGVDGTLKIVPEEAAVVRAIYEWRNDGASLREIVRRLMDAEVKAPRGGDVWHIEAIRRILSNEKYYGDVCLQKTFIADYFTGKQRPNHGEYDFFLCEDHHEAIIPKEKSCKNIFEPP